MKHKHQIFMVLMVIFTAFLFVLNVYPFIFANGAGGGYEGSSEGGSPGIQAVADQSVEYYIMTAGTYYLESSTQVQTLLKLVEQQDIQGINYTEMQSVVNRALNDMQMAKDTYEQLIRKAEATPYNEAFSAKLKNFDYESFAVKNSLNPNLFDLVRLYLQNGDITGMFKRTYADVTNMIDILYKIRESVSQNLMPDIGLFRQLNEKQALSSVFGSYAARVFSEIQ